MRGSLYGSRRPRDKRRPRNPREQQCLRRPSSPRRSRTSTLGPISGTRWSSCRPTPTRATSWRRGDDVFFLSGSDENSLKNVLAAEREGITTRELVDRNVRHFEQLLSSAADLSFVGFIRTSVDARSPGRRAGNLEPDGRRATTSTKATYEGLYCVGCEQFYMPAELVDGVCPDHRTEPELIRERNLFFRLSRYADQLLAALDSRQPQDRAADAAATRSPASSAAGSQDISISRSIQRARGWGIPVPRDPAKSCTCGSTPSRTTSTRSDWVSRRSDYQRYWGEGPRRIHVVGKGVCGFTPSTGRRC